MKAVNDFVCGLLVLVSVIGLGIVASIVFGGSNLFFRRNRYINGLCCYVR